jgi:hypothetical protein
MTLGGRSSFNRVSCTVTAVNAGGTDICKAFFLFTRPETSNPQLRTIVKSDSRRCHLRRRSCSSPASCKGDANDPLRRFPATHRMRPMRRSVQSSALHCRLNHKRLVQQRKTLHAVQVIS